MELRISWILLVCMMFRTGSCWDNDELEIFDLVEEINTNFYALLGVEQDAESSEIRKAYRKLSLILHPDKNDAPDADIKFRQLVSVYDTLRDTKKRQLYNNVLVNGLPDWKHAIYYYRRARKVGLIEMSILLFGIITVGQYIVAWAAYAERKYTCEQLMDLRLKKLQKKQKKGKYDGPPLPDSIDIDIPKPSVVNTLPCQIPRLAWFLVTNAPRSVGLVREFWAERKRRKEEAEQWSEEEEEVMEVEPRAPRRRRPKPTLPEYEPPSTTATNPNAPAPGAEEAEPSAPLLSGGFWTDDDLVELVRLIKKFPPGTSARWDRIGAAMGRSVAEITHMAKKMKEDGYRVGKPEGEPEPQPEELRKVKTKGGKLGLANGDAEPAEVPSWTQPQQKALEAALIKFPKGGTQERWEKIAKAVPGKTKEECMVRYKQLVEVVKKRKENCETQEATQ